VSTIEDYTRDLSDLAGLAAHPHAVADVLSRALDSLSEIVPYDLAAVMELEGQTLRVVAAAGSLAGPQVLSHKLDLSKAATVRKALEQRRPIALTEHEHRSDEGDPYDGVLDLPPGHACMVVPLFAGDRSLGVISLDRKVCETYSNHSVQQAGVYGRLVALSLVLARQSELLSRYRSQLREQNRLLEERIGVDQAACQRLESSRSLRMRDLTQRAKQVAQADVPVLIQGETGTGKEVLARAIHGYSRRKDRPFVTLNCAALPEHLVESELFGHVKGAFSGAARDRAGRFITANGGTLLLDEIGEMPLAAQAKLLRVLQEGTFEAVGSDQTVRVDVRVIAATHVDLKTAIQQGRFREDLYFRLAIFPLVVPPLRERREDILTIAEHFLTQQNTADGRDFQLSPSAVAALDAYEFPGNVRELINALERALILCPDTTISAQDLALPVGRRDHSPTDIPKIEKAETTSARLPTFKEQERNFLLRALASTSGRVHGPLGAAVMLDLKPTTLQSKLKKHGIDRASFVPTNNKAS